MRYLTYILIALFIASCGEDVDEAARLEAENKAREDSIKALIEAARQEGEEKARQELRLQQLKEEEKARLAAEERAIKEKLSEEQMNADELAALEEKKKQWAKEDDASVMIIKRLILKKMPMIKISGAGWDPDSGPDVFFSLSHKAGNDEEVFYESPVEKDISPALIPVIWDQEISIELKNIKLNEIITVKVFDKDDNEENEELMSILRFKGVSFVKEEDSRTRKRIRLKYYEKDVTIINEKGDMALRLELDWK